MPVYPNTTPFPGDKPLGSRVTRGTVTGAPVTMSPESTLRERAVTFSQFEGSETGRIAPGYPTASQSAIPDRLAPLRTRQAVKALVAPAFGYYSVTPTQPVKPVMPGPNVYARPAESPLETHGRYRQEKVARRGVSSQVPQGGLTTQDLVVVGGIAAFLLIVLFATTR